MIFLKISIYVITNSAEISYIDKRWSGGEELQHESSGIHVLQLPYLKNGTLAARGFQTAKH